MIGDQVSESLPVSFGSLLRSLRMAAGLTQEELAEAARVSYRSISDLERGVSRSPRRDTARLLADALGLSGDDRAQFEAAARGQPPAAEKIVPRPLSGGIAAATFTLPRDIASFTGREPEIESILTALTGAGAGVVADICAISGMAGIGKTALAVHVAHRLADRFPDGQIFLQLHGHTPGHQPVDPADALASLLQASGIPVQFIPDGLEPRALLWRDRLAGRRMLLVLDNAASTGQVASLLPGDGGCRVLVTSRRHLGDLPGAATPVLLDVLTPAQAAQMFTRLAPRAAGSPDEVAEMARLAGFLPLAISLLARLSARHQSWTLADLAAETRASLLTLTAERESVAVAFEVSYRHLDSARQRMFCLLGLHPGVAFEPYAAAALAGTGLDEASALLDGLHGEGLLIETGRRRYGLHDLLRRYARDHAADLPGSERAAERLLDYYQHTAARADALITMQPQPGPPPAALAEPLAVPDLDDDGQALAWARAERANLLACLDHAATTGQHSRVVTLTAGIAGLLRFDGPFGDAVIRLAAAARAASRLGDCLGQANALTHMGGVQWRWGDYRGAAQVLEQALDIYRDLGDRLGEANALIWLGTTLRYMGDYQGGTQVLEQALEIYRGIGDQHGQANALLYLCRWPWTTGGYQDAAGVLEEALRIYRDLGSRIGQASALVWLGVARRRAKDYPGAVAVLEQGLCIFRDLGYQAAEATALNQTGTLHKARGEVTQAEECHQQALELARATSSSWDEAHALAGLGRCAMASGNAVKAGVLLRQALEIFQRIGAAEARDLLAEVNAHTGPRPRG
jgi:tetratricopeptide (TPR) repeat protein/transcriptional regulator with XRE-family HTH domain